MGSSAVMLLNCASAVMLLNRTSAVMLLNRTSAVMLLNRTRGVVWALDHLWALVHKTNYAPMIYSALCFMLLMWVASITWASGRGLGPGNLNFFGPQMALAYRLDAIPLGPEKSRFPGPDPPPTFFCNGCCLHQKH